MHAAGNCKKIEDAESSQYESMLEVISDSVKDGIVYAFLTGLTCYIALFSLLSGKEAVDNASTNLVHDNKFDKLGRLIIVTCLVIIIRHN